MCDTQLIKNGEYTYFAKNSDREPGEAQLVVRNAPMQNDDQSKLRTTYLEIDQVGDRFGTILSKPFWIWGAEIGANDQGVVIGNEAVFSKVMEEETGLIGMDLLRLGLERGSSAEHALRVIAELLEKYGQGGPCGYRDKKFRYDNSFIIADAEEAWILETANRHWVAKKVNTTGAISNCLTIGTEFDLSSNGIEDFAIKRKLFSGKRDFDFRKTFDTWFFPFFGGSHERLQCSNDLLDLTRKSSDVGLKQIFDNLRSHKIPFRIPWFKNSDICEHAAGYIRRHQTCGSQVSRLSKVENLHFFTGTSAPCLSIFKPVSFNADAAFSVLNPDEQSVENSIWQRHEAIHRRVILDSDLAVPLTKSRDQVETGMLSLFESEFPPTGPEAFETADQMTMEWQKRWHDELKDQPFPYSMTSPYSWYWKIMNRKDGFD